MYRRREEVIYKKNCGYIHFIARTTWVAFETFALAAAKKCKIRGPPRKLLVIDSSYSHKRPSESISAKKWPCSCTGVCIEVSGFTALLAYEPSGLIGVEADHVSSPCVFLEIWCGHSLREPLGSSKQAGQKQSPTFPSSQFSMMQRPLLGYTAFESGKEKKEAIFIFTSSFFSSCSLFQSYKIWLPPPGLQLSACTLNRYVVRTYVLVSPISPPA